ncbi:MAG: hypothetical protein IJS00_05970 [Paludibacteraceae bacterium]|nr:hypothetical protein [Paludibacteraceae bacterium]
MTAHYLTIFTPHTLMQLKDICLSIPRRTLEILVMITFCESPFLYGTT